MFVSAVVPAAGLGSRLKSRLPKPLVRLNKKPVFIHTLQVLSRHPDIKEIILVVSTQSLKPTKAYLKKYRIKKINELILGGPRRRDSVRNGLRHVSPQADFILIHDAARPFLTLDMLSAVIQQAKKTGAAVLGVPINSTVKEAAATGRVIRTLRRQRLYEIQTPQVFRASLITDAYRRFPHIEATDDAYLVEKSGKGVVIVSGSYSNIKITTQADLAFARFLEGHPPSLF